MHLCLFAGKYDLYIWTLLFYCSVLDDNSDGDGGGGGGGGDGDGDGGAQILLFTESVNLDFYWFWIILNNCNEITLMHQALSEVEKEHTEETIRFFYVKILGLVHYCPYNLNRTDPSVSVN